MGNVRFKDSKVLFESNKVAMDNGCCCGGGVEGTCCDKDGGLMPATIAASISVVVNCGGENEDPDNICEGCCCEQTVCTDANGSWFLDHEIFCDWNTTGPISCCTLDNGQPRKTNMFISANITSFGNQCSLSVSAAIHIRRGVEDQSCGDLMDPSGGSGDICFFEGINYGNGTDCCIGEKTLNDGSNCSGSFCTDGQDGTAVVSF